MANQAIINNSEGMRRRKDSLNAKLKELMELSRTREELRIEYEADPLDQVRSSADREMAVGRVDQETHLIHDIQEALDKIEEGSYGLCETCEEPIAPKRLDAVPWARLCIACQSQTESAKRNGEVMFEDAA